MAMVGKIGAARGVGVDDNVFGRLRGQRTYALLLQVT